MFKLDDIWRCFGKCYYWQVHLFTLGILVSVGSSHVTAKEIEGEKVSFEDPYFWSAISTSIPTVAGKTDRRRSLRRFRILKNSFLGKSKIVSKSIFILQGILENGEHGLNAGGVLISFGMDLGNFGLINEPVNSGQFSIALETTSGGFTGPNVTTDLDGNTVLNNFIGFTKVFDQTINAFDGDGTKLFSHLAYSVFSPKPRGDDGSSINDITTFFVSQIIIGDGIGEDGSTWVESAPRRTSLEEPNNENNPISGRPSILEFSEKFTRRIIPLVAENVFPGYFRIAGKGDLDLTRITQVGFLLLRWDEGGNDGKRSVFFDDITFVKPPFELEISSSPVSNVPFLGRGSIVGDFEDTTPRLITGLANNERVEEEVTLTATEESISAGSGQVLNFDHWEVNGEDFQQGLREIKVEMIEDTKAIAIYKAKTFTFALKSTAEGVEITGLPDPISGIKELNMEIVENTIIRLTARKQVPADNGTLYFIEWQLDNGMVTPSTTISLQIKENVNVEAVYELRHDLTINSTATSGFSITGSHPNTTNYSESLLTGTTISLATDDQILKGIKYRFNGWIINGEKETTGSKNVNFSLNQNTTLVAEFVLQNELDVIARDQGNQQSIQNVLITGTHTGSSNYVVSIDSGTKLTLTAPTLHVNPVNKEKFRFLKWNIDSEGTQIFNQQTVSFTVNSDTQARAEYAKGEFLLNVVSIPIEGVGFQSDSTKKGGASNYVRGMDNGNQVNLKAPEEISLATSTLSFNHWNLIFKNKPMIQMVEENINFTISEDTTAVACYDPVFSLEVGWNLIASPLADIPANVKQLLNLNDSMWKWGNNTFQTSEEIWPGNGYWVYSQNKVTVKTEGNEPEDSVISLSLGWNLIGIKGYQLLSTTNSSDQFLQLPPNSRIASDIWGWNNEFQKFSPITDSSLQAFQQNMMFPSYGYWVYVTN